MAWTDEEIRKYRPRDYAPLRKMYEQAGLSEKEPDKIVAYLMKNTPPSTSLCRALILISENYGKAAALNLLEEVVIAEHGEPKSKRIGEVTPRMFN